MSKRNERGPKVHGNFGSGVSEAGCASRRNTAFQEPSNEGFTLLEVMIALAIIGIAFISLLGLRNRDIVLSDHSKAITQATLLARQKMTEMELAGFPPLGELSGEFQETPRFRWHERVVAPELLPTYSNIVREVTVTVSWDEKERVDLVAYLFNTR
jgi:general secretion pathway protein I